jgi:hypothetical protein
MNKKKWSRFVLTIGFAIFGIVFLPAITRAATLALSPAAQTVSVGNTFTVSILLDTTGQSIYGVDIYSLRYDPTALEAQDANSTAAGVQIQAGTLMTDVQYNTVNSVAGAIQFSQTAATTGGNYSGIGTLATVTFKALKSGPTNVTFDFTPGSTTDTNVAVLYTDVLTAVTNGSYTLNISLDSTAPTVPANVTASSTSTTSINLAWTASTDPVVAGQSSSGVAGYKIYRGATSGSVTTQVGTSTTASFSDAGLAAGTTYFYKVAAYDNQGNTSAQSVAVQAATASGPDTTAPSIPSNVTASGFSTTGVTVTWWASTDPAVVGQTTSGVSGYRIYRNGSASPTATVSGAASLSFSDTGLSPGTSYSYTVASVDAAGNVSAKSSAVSASTQSNPDITAPSASISSPSAGQQYSGNVTISATGSDPVVAGQVSSGIFMVSVYLDNVLFVFSQAGTVSKSLDTTTAVNGSHTVVAVARDNAGNQASSTPVSFTVYNLLNAERYPRKIKLGVLEGLSTAPVSPLLTATVLSPSNLSVLSVQTPVADAGGEYTVTFQNTFPETVTLRVAVNGYLSRLISNIVTTDSVATALVTPQLLAGDFNNDNVINSLDYSLLNTNWNQNFLGADINKDGLVNSLDFAVLKNNYGKVGE